MDDLKLSQFLAHQSWYEMSLAVIANKCSK